MHTYSFTQFIISIGGGCLLYLGSAAASPPPEDGPLKDNRPEIAVSLDDVPMPGTVLFKGIDRTQAIIQKLQAVDSPPVGIFALGVHAQQPFGMERLQMYAEAGHLIANHSYSHYKLKDVSAETFIKDIQKAHKQLCGLPNFRPWFRFPYLHEGNSTQQRAAVLQALAAMGYQQGYVTVCNYDFRINQLLVQAVKKNQAVDYDKLRELYLNILWDGIDFADQLAYEVLGRRIKQVLLLHANDLAAHYIGDLIEFIRNKGWKVISIEEAYKDPIATLQLTNTFSQQGRIAAIARERKQAHRVLPYPSQSYDYIQKALEQAQVFSTPDSHQK